MHAKMRKYFLKSIICFPFVASALHVMPAHAISTGCNNISASNFTSDLGTSSDTLGPFNFEAGEQLTVNVTVTINLDIEVTVDGQVKTILNSKSGTLVFTINNTGASTIVLKTINAVSRPDPLQWNPTYAFSCSGSSGDSSDDSSSSDTANARQAVDKDAAQAQLDVVSTNIGVRIANIGSPAGIGRNSPSGVDRNIPGGGGEPINDQPTNLSNFSGFGSPSERKTQESRSIRDLLMHASFDSSDMSYGVAGDESESDVSDVLRARSDLPANRPLTAHCQWKQRQYLDIEATHYTQLTSYRQAAILSLLQLIQLYTHSAQYT